MIKFKKIYTEKRIIKNNIEYFKYAALISKNKNYIIKKTLIDYFEFIGKKIIMEDDNKKSSCLNIYNFYANKPFLFQPQQWKINELYEYNYFAYYLIRYLK